MKTLISIILALVFANEIIAQEYIIQVKPFSQKKWGYANLNGDIVIEAKFSKCSEFCKKGYALVQNAKNKNYYFINIKGEILDLERTDLTLKQYFGFGTIGFSCGMAPMGFDGKWGYINTAGKVAVDIKYDYVTRFYEGFAFVKVKRKFLILDTPGNEISIKHENVVDMKHFSDGLAIIITKDKKYGFINTSGEVVIEPRFIKAGYFKGGLAWVKPISRNVGHRYINKKGEFAFDTQFEAVKNFDPVSGMARVKRYKRWTYVNTLGEVLKMKELELYGDFYDGLCRGKKGRKFGFYDNSGEWVIQPKFDGVRDFKNGYAAVLMNEKWGVINKKGEWVIEPVFANIKDVEIVE